MTTPVNLAKVNHVFDAQVLQGIRYRLGGKAPNLSAAPSHLSAGIDCSGEVRVLLFQGTDGDLTIPDGSWNQRAWCEKNLEEVPYSQAIHAKKGELYIAFITSGANGAGKIGHVWLIAERDGSAIAETMESYGGHGIGSRPANTGVLVRLVHKCFKMPTVAAAAKPVPAPQAPVAVVESLTLNADKIPDARKVNGRWFVPLRETAAAGKMVLQQVSADGKGGESWRFYK